MSDTINDELPKISKEEALEDTLYQFVRLYEQWVEDRQILVKQNTDLQGHVKRFSAEVREFERYRADTQNQIRESIRGAAAEITKELSKKIKEDVQEAVRDSSRALAKSANEASEILSVARSNSESNAWKIVAGGLFSAIVVALFIFWRLTPDPVIIDESFKTTWQKGSTLEVFWPKLNEKQRQWLIDLANDKVINHGKSIDSIGDKNHGD